MRRNETRQQDLSLLTGPVRSCVSCRLRNEVSKMFRFVRRKDGEVVFDRSQVLDGRGAYICKERRCFDIAFERKAFGRAFKRDILLDKKFLEIAVF